MTGTPDGTCNMSLLESYLTLGAAALGALAVGVSAGAGVVIYEKIHERAFTEALQKFQSNPRASELRIPETNNLKGYFKSKGIDINSDKGKAYLAVLEQTNPELVCGYKAEPNPRTASDVPVPCLKAGLYDAPQW